MGNWDACFLEGMPEAKDEVGQKLVDTGEWWAQFLSDEDREFMRSFVPTIDIDLDGLEALFFHGSPASYDDWIFATTPDDELRAMLDGHAEPALVGGHTHLQLVRRFEKSISSTPGASVCPSSSGGRGRYGSPRGPSTGSSRRGTGGSRSSFAERPSTSKSS